MHWENLNSHQPPPNNFIVADTELDKHLIIAFAQIGDPTPLSKPGFDPELYRYDLVPVTFSRRISLNALAGIKEKVQSQDDDLMQLAAEKILDALGLTTTNLPQAA